MTIGDKIKYYRTQLGITQGKLAELSGIHPVSIRKYETNKVTPQLPHIEKLSAALGVSSIALTGIGNDIRIETTGDLIGLVIALVKANVLEIGGKRSNSGALREDTVTVRVNPLLAQFFSFNSVKADEMLYSVTSPVVLDNLLKWEKMYNKFRKLEKQYGKSGKEEKTQTGGLRSLPKRRQDAASIGKQDALGELSEILEKIELEVQRSDVLLDRAGGIKVIIK